MGERRFGLGGFLLIASIVIPAAVLPLHAATKRPFIQKRYLRVISGGSVSVTFKKPNAAGNLIVAYVVWDNGGAVVAHRQPRQRLRQRRRPDAGDRRHAQRADLLRHEHRRRHQHGHGDLRDRDHRARRPLRPRVLRDSIGPRRSTRRSRRRDRRRHGQRRPDHRGVQATCCSSAPSRTADRSDALTHGYQVAARASTAT